MKLRLYFEGRRLFSKPPARITVHDFGNPRLQPSELRIDCEYSDNGKWGALRGKWKPIDQKERALHLRKALEVLSAQRHRALDALGIEHDNEVIVPLKNAVLKLTHWTASYKKKPMEFWSFMFEIAHNGSTQRFYAHQFTNKNPFTYEWVFREAIIALLSKEVELKKSHGLRLTASFADLEKALRKTASRHKDARHAIGL